MRALLGVIAALIGLVLAPGAGALPLPGAPSCPIFPADNPWNQPVDGLPVAASSDAIVRSIGLDETMHADFGSGTWNMFAQASSAPGGGSYPNGPHGFTFGADGDLYMAFARGSVEVYDGQTGAWLRTLWTVADKLCDVQFKPVPTPGSLALMGVAAVAAGRRRRR